MRRAAGGTLRALADLDERQLRDIGLSSKPWSAE